MNANQRRKFARAFVADLKAATEDDVIKSLIESAEEHLNDQRQINRLEKEIASLKQQLEVHEANVVRFISADKSMQQQLAAAQATNAKMRVALTDVGKMLFEDQQGFDHELFANALTAALNSEDNTVLRQYRDSVIEECANVCEGGSFLHENAPDALFAKACAKAIRKLKANS